MTKKIMANSERREGEIDTLNISQVLHNEKRINKKKLDGNHAIEISKEWIAKQKIIKS